MSSRPDREAIRPILKRRSIRNHTAASVTEEEIRLILEAGIAAPSAHDQKSWEFIVITAPEILARLREKLHFGRYEAPCAIAVCDDKRKGLPERDLRRPSHGDEGTADAVRRIANPLAELRARPIACTSPSLGLLHARQGVGESTVSKPLAPTFTKWRRLRNSPFWPGEM